MPHAIPSTFIAVLTAVTLVCAATGSMTFQSSPPAVTPPSTAAPTPVPTPTATPAAAPRPKAKERVKEVKDVTGTIVTGGKQIQFKLHVQKTPTLCANFCNLARRGFFDGQPWKGFTRVVCQAGTESAIYTLPREFAADLSFNSGLQMAYAKASEKTAAPANATRIFLTLKGQERWNLDFQIFGAVTSGLAVLQELGPGSTIDRVELSGDVDNLLKVFEPEIAEWNAALDRPDFQRIQPSGPTLPGDPNHKPPAIPIRPRSEGEEPPVPPQAPPKPSL
ncbi:MAG: peptidylprolyl isomerase [Phycisphaerae bacterium]|nr:peptidylprolyl isomerase [Phycisphaerae bacterium]